MSGSGKLLRVLSMTCVEIANKLRKAAAVAVIAVMLAFLPAPSASAAEIHVPADYATIQSAVDHSSEDDTIIVSPGRYVENVVVSGKVLNLRSIDPADPGIVAATTIDGSGLAPCVKFTQPKSLPPIGGSIQGFTVTNGTYGILFEHASIAAVKNLVIGNKGIGLVCAGPWGRTYAAMQIVENTIINNESDGPAGVVAWGYVSPAIIGNLVIGNSSNYWGAIGISDAGEMLVSGNLILGNSGPRGAGISAWNGIGLVTNNLILGNQAEWGGGIELTETSDLVIANNTILSNRAKAMGGGIHMERSSGEIVNCTFAGNTAPQGSELYVTRTGGSLLTRNLIQGQKTGIVLSNATITTLGNIDADPLFVDPGHWDDSGTPGDLTDDKFIPGDYHLLPASPCIDAGTNDVDNPDTPEVETLPATDIAGIPRVIDGNRDGTATVDMGAYEYLPGDVNYDGKVNVLDLLNVRNSMGADPASSLAARKADLNADGRVDVLDLIAARNAVPR